MSAPAQDARRLLELHRTGDPLVLPNVWDAITAGAVEAAGFPVVATTSAGVAHALGYDDHEGAPAEEMLAAVERIARSVTVPVTADLEAGYGLDPSVLVAALLDAGAVGMNIEDTDHATGGLRGLDDQAARIAGLRDAATAAGVDVVVNARIDLVLHAEPEAPPAADEYVRRARAYVEAGASCVFPILVGDPAVLADIVRGVDAPVNALLLPGGPTVAELAALGVRRISLGSQLERAAAAFVAERLEGLRQQSASASSATQTS